MAHHRRRRRPAGFRLLSLSPLARLISRFSTSNRLPTYLIFSGLLAVILALSLFLAIFYPVAKVEINYQLHRPDPQPQTLEPVDPDFGLVIPKIGANAKIIPNVDPYDSRVYQRALTQGVAHAQGTALPGEQGNVFLFSHSSTNFYEATRYNSIFYLLDKLEPGDDIYLFYHGTKLHYQVTAKKIVAPTAVSYLKGSSPQPKLTLMTCWPPGTSLNRLLILATLKSE